MTIEIFDDKLIPKNSDPCVKKSTNRRKKRCRKSRKTVKPTPIVIESQSQPDQERMDNNGQPIEENSIETNPTQDFSEVHCNSRLERNLAIDKKERIRAYKELKKQALRLQTEILIASKVNSSKAIELIEYKVEKYADNGEQLAEVIKEIQSKINEETLRKHQLQQKIPTPTHYTSRIFISTWQIASISKTFHNSKNIHSNKINQTQSKPNYTSQSEPFHAIKQLKDIQPIIQPLLPISEEQNEKQLFYDNQRLWDGSWICRGLYNEGLYCYQNASLQCLMHTVPFIKVLINQRLDPNSVPGVLQLTAVEYHRLRSKHEENSEFDLVDSIYDLWRPIVKFFQLDSDTCIDSSKLRRQMSQKKPFYNENRQGDSFEFMMDLITSCYDKEPINCVSKYGRDGAASDIFKGVMDMELRCGCGITSHANVFFALTIPLPQYSSIDLKICLQRYLNPPIRICDVCQQEKSIKQSVQLYPEVLILQLNRFISDRNGLHKNGVPLDKIPLYSPCEEFAGYELYGVIRHTGNTNGGHYWSNVKVNGKWYNFNDSSVTDDFVPHATGTEYILLYRNTLNK